MINRAAATMGSIDRALPTRPPEPAPMAPAVRQPPAALSFRPSSNTSPLGQALLPLTRLAQQDLALVANPARLLHFAKQELDPESREVLGFAAQVAEPLGRLAKTVLRRGRWGRPWSSAAPQEAEALREALNRVRPTLRAPHTRRAADVYLRALDAASPADWHRVTALVARQNRQLVESKASMGALVAFFPDSGPPYPSLYLIQRLPIPKTEQAFLRQVSGRLGFDESSSGLPTTLFARELLVSPPESRAAAFALHTNAGIVFEEQSPSLQAARAALAAKVGLRPDTLERLRRLYFSAHEVGHKADPGTLPTWTEELVADSAAISAGFDLLAQHSSPRAALATVAAGALENYFWLTSENDPQEPYRLSSDHILTQLIQSGAMRVLPGPRLRFYPEHADTFLEHAKANWRAFSSGRVPPSIQRTPLSPHLATLRSLSQDVFKA